MPRTSESAKKAAETTRKRYGDKFFKERARKGGKASSGGFKTSEQAREAAMKGVAKRWKQSDGGATS